MTLVVEAGACDKRANSYVTIEYCDAYHAERANAAWANATNDAKTAAVIRATAFIDARYINRWKGEKQWPLDRLRQWPRIPDVITASPALVRFGYYGDLEFTFAAGEVPEPVKQATAEAAIRSLAADLIPDLQRGGRIVSQTINLGGLSRSTTWAPGAPPATSFGLIDGILAPVLARGSMIRGVARA